jgi:hypothetical protein
MGTCGKKHKSLIGEECNEACGCVSLVPDMLESFVESLERGSGGPLAFVTIFAKHQLEPLLEEHPEESPRKTLERLQKLYKEEPSLRPGLDNLEMQRGGSFVDHPEKCLPQKIPRNQSQGNGAVSGDLLLSKIAPKMLQPGDETVQDAPMRSTKIPQIGT